MNKRLCFVFFMLIPVLLSAQNSLIRMPRISPNSQEMAFSYQGDIWIHNFDTEQSKRLTIHEGYESNPIWNTSGDQLAFSSNRKGANDIFIVKKMEEHLNN
jgi:Tol biopolymer transport system component